MILLEKKRVEKEPLTPKMGQIALAVSLIACLVIALLIIGFYTVPEKTKIIYSFILSNQVTYYLFGGLMYCGVVLSPFSLLCLIDV